jgi:outer membrane immunogenic protein
VFDLSNVGGTGNLKSNGVLFGLGAGYDFAASPKVALGLDIEATDSTTDIQAGTDRISAGRDLYAGGRLTAALSDRANLYLKAGYTNARLKGTTGGVSQSTNLDGVRGGIGLQFALGEKAYVSGEYRYSNYQSDVTRHQGVLALGVRF